MATTPTTTTTTPPSTPIILNIDYLNESWCELHYKSTCSSSGSISHLNHSVNPEVLEKLLQEAQKESQFNASSFENVLPTTINTNQQQQQQSPFSFQEEFDDTSSSISSPLYIISDKISSPSSLYPSLSKNSKNINIINKDNSNSTKSITSTISGTSISTNANKILKMNPCYNVNICNDKNIIDDFLENQDEEVDLEYEDEDEENNTVNKNSMNDLTLNNSKDKIDDKRNLTKRKLDLSMENNSVETVKNCHLNDNNIITEGKTESKCLSCFDYQKQIDILEKQLRHEIKMRKENEDKLLLQRSLNLTSSSSNSSATSTPPSFNQNKFIDANNNNLNNGHYFIKHQQPQIIVNNNVNSSKLNTSNDLMRNFSSRIQVNPPKEFNLVHPFSISKSKLNSTLMNSTEEDVAFSSKSSNKIIFGGYFLIFTHVSCFIFGLSLLYLFNNKHLTHIKSIIV